MNVIASLREFDGRHTSVLEQLAATVPRNDDSLKQLFIAAKHDEEPLQVGATWILKRWHEEGAAQLEKAIAPMIRLLKSVSHWEARLHLLQLLADLPISARSSSALEKFLPDLLKDDNKLVRAWSLTVLVAIADQREASRRNVIPLLLVAENDQAASVRARVRQIRKRYKWAALSGRTKR